MSRNFKEALEHRRSYYQICDKSPIPDEQIESIIDFAIMNVPSAFNSQSTRIVLLLGKHHERLWEITKDALRLVVPAQAFKVTEEKINKAFQSGHGTVLFFEDSTTVEGLQKQFPAYADKFPVWSQQTSAMHQLVIWTMLEDAGFGASLQHYSPLIDQKTTDEWAIDPAWKLVAEMPFGTPLLEPKEKQYNPIKERFVIFK